MNKYTNNKHDGKNFGKEIKVHLNSSIHLDIASGYFSYKLFNQLKKQFIDIAKKGSCRILIGMIFHERVTSSQKKCLIDLDNALKKINNRSGIYITTQQYHGKIFKFKKQNEDKYFVGSSNFSYSGFNDNIEYNLEIKDKNDKNAIDDFLKFLFEETDSKRRIGYPLNEIALKLKKSKGKGKKSLNNYKISNKNFPTKKIISTHKILLRPDQQPSSSLNLYFAKGRKSQKNGKYTPRPWYEIEITSQKQEQMKKGYPKGKWTAFVKDNNNSYKLDMITSSGDPTFPKAIQTYKGRHILGEYIKGKLEKKGSLKKYERITSDTLDHYGRDFIELNEMPNKEYILVF